MCAQVFAGETILESVYLENATQSSELSPHSEAYIDLQLNILRFLVETKQHLDNSSDSKVNTGTNEAVINYVRKEIEKMFEFEVDFAMVSRAHGPVAPPAALPLISQQH